MDFPRGALVWLPTENVRVRELLVDHKIDRIEFAVTTFERYRCCFGAEEVRNSG